MRFNSEEQQLFLNTQTHISAMNTIRRTTDDDDDVQKKRWSHILELELGGKKKMNEGPFTSREMRIAQTYYWCCVCDDNSIWELMRKITQTSVCHPMNIKIIHLFLLLLLLLLFITSHDTDNRTIDEQCTLLSHPTNGRNSMSVDWYEKSGHMKKSTKP